MLDNPELSTDGKDMPLFWKKKSNAFPLRPGMPRAILTLPLCFLILLFSVTAPYLNIYTDMLSQTHTHRWLMWCLRTISANSFPLHSLSSASLCDGVGQLVQSSLDFFILKMTTTQEPATYISPLWHYGAKNRECHWFTPASKPIYHPAFPSHMF